MYFGEQKLSLRKLPKPMRPMVGGAVVGLMGVAYVMIFGWSLLHTDKPFAFKQYPPCPPSSGTVMA